MGNFKKVLVVVCGYVAAFTIASLIVYLRQLVTPAAALAGSPGMYAFGDLMLFAGVFTLISLIPTGMTLYFLRPFEKIWVALSVFVLAIAVTAPVGAILSALTMKSMSPQPARSPLVIAGEFGFLRTMGAPLFFLVFLTFAIFAPSRRTRWSMLVATGFEGVACLYFMGHMWLSSHL
jgi:hypothetical protein